MLSQNMLRDRIKAKLLRRVKSRGVKKNEVSERLEKLARQLEDVVSNNFAFLNQLLSDEESDLGIAANAMFENYLAFKQELYDLAAMAEKETFNELG